VPMAFDPYDYESIKGVMAHCNVVINLTGKHFETMNWNWQNVHCDLPEAMAMAAAEEGIETFIHMSALGADADSSSKLMRSKAAGEKAVLAALPTATIFRPAPIIGLEDRYLNFMQDLLRMPGPMQGTFPLMDGGENKQQPVHVTDVAQACVEAMMTVDSQGQTYELAGPEQYTISQLADHMFEAVRVNEDSRAKQVVPKDIVKFVAETMGMRLPLINTTPGMNGDWAERLTLECVKSEGSLGFEDLNIVPSNIETKTRYMEKYTKQGARGLFLQI